jgi:hypothetical protein
MIQVGNTQYDEDHFVKKIIPKKDHFVECTYGSLISVACGWRGLKNFFCNNQQFQCYLTSHLKTIKKLEWLSRITELC